MLSSSPYCQSCSVSQLPSPSLGTRSLHRTKTLVPSCICVIIIIISIFTILVTENIKVLFIITYVTSLFSESIGPLDALSSQVNKQ